MKAKITNKDSGQVYEGRVGDMPGWARAIIAPRYRRVLTHPLTIFFTVVASVSFTALHTYPMEFLVLPGWFLLVEIAEIAHKQWVREAFEEFIEKNSVISTEV
ncbi:hypothetical protein [Rhodopseudomonas palustris]|uniref:hypothetical protein n=1 Tax=Rhodopseudomonas palustris TaxID=1076 RepID=UPI00131D15E2|nr:hypothetical protein [Rhodopseudomonas palustris]